MDNSIYVALSRQTAQFRNMEITANNIANANTPGFSAQRLVFSDYVMKDNQWKTHYANDPSTYRDTSSGSIRMSGNALDVAISGPGYFQVQTNLGRRYTKAGNFQVNADGTMVTPSGYPVLGADGGQIVLPANAKDVKINGVGQVVVDGEDVGQIGIAEFTDQQRMTRLGGTLYSANEQPIAPDNSRLVQGGVESSNVSAVSEMTKVMEISRTVSGTAKFVETMYDLQRKTSTAYTRSQSA